MRNSGEYEAPRWHALFAAIVFIACLVALASLARAQSAANAAAINEGTDPPSRTSAPCHVRYHQRLQSIATEDMAQVRAALEKLTQTRTDIPRAWSFWPRTLKRKRRRRVKNGKILPMMLRGKVCTDEIETRGGRRRCRQWLPATPELIEAHTVRVRASDPRPNRAERRDLNLMNDTVLTRGKLSSFADGGRFYYLVRKLVDDLEGYVRQANNPGLCNGVQTLTAFYRTRLEPIDERVALIDSLIRRSETRAIAAATRLDAALKKRAAEIAKKAVDTTSTTVSLATSEDASPSATMGQQRIGQPLTEVDVKAALASTELIGAAKSLLSAVDRMAPATMQPGDNGAGSFANEDELAKALARVDPDADLTTMFFTRARVRVDQAQVRAGGRSAARRAIIGLRALETLHIARRTRAIYTDFVRDVTRTLETIRQAHRASCDC